MSVFPQALRKRGVLIAALVLLVVAVMGILAVVISPLEDPMTPRQANDKMTTFVDSTLAHVAPGYPTVPGSPDGGAGACVNRFGGTTDGNSLGYVREITDFDFDAALGDEIVERAEEYWREQGFDVGRDERTAGVTVMWTGADDFGYYLFVNRNTSLILMIGKMPCFPRSDLREAGLV